MGTSSKYGKVMTQSGGIPLDEPVFIIRAQDALSCPLLSAYFTLCEKAGAPADHLRGVELEYTRFADWQEAHSGQVKTPGTPG